jgi:2,3,4,5-tetrahydropyridine-2-carboxylate N-succinyltransferase
VSRPRGPESERAGIASAIEALWDAPAEAGLEAVDEVLRLLDEGEVRVAERRPDGWIVNEWVKKAILLAFRLRRVEPVEIGPFEYLDKLPLKRDYGRRGVRVVPPATARYGSFLSEGVVLMPSYVNVGAWVGPRTMVDTWATVGSCAQIGADVHLSGGVGIGGVLEPPQAQPVIVEDGAFVGSRSIVVEGVVVGERAVLGANVVITASTPIIDVTGPEPIEHRGLVPPGSVVIPGTRPREYPAGTYGVPAALVIGRRSASTDLKVSLNDALRTFDVAV